MSILGIGGVLALMTRTPEPAREYVAGQVVVVGCARYRVVSVAADGEPTMTRLEDET